MRKVACPTCTNDSGIQKAFAHFTSGICPRCHGKGYIYRLERHEKVGTVNYNKPKNSQP